MADQLNPEEESLLQSALQTAFSPAPLPKQPVLPENPPEPETAPEAAPAEEPAATDSVPTYDSAEDVWKAEYEGHVAEWRRRSAEQRELAERERARWEEIRRRERAEGRPPRSESGWESVGGSTSASVVIEGSTRAASVATGEPSVADARDLVSGEHSGKHSKEELEILPGAPMHAQTPTPPDAESHKWEDIHSDSLASSYPSLSYPSDPHSPSSGSHPRLHAPPRAGHHDAHAGPHHAHDPAPPTPVSTATHAIFDSSLSTRTRVFALIASLAVNVGLPFINGVMLGFGEIFAKDVVVGWFGFRRGTAAEEALRGRQKSPGSREAGVGLGVPR